jgi:hypothetical protein
MHLVPVELIGLPPVWVDQVLELEIGSDVDGMWIDEMEEVAEGAGYASELVLPIVDATCYFAL